MKNLNDYIWFNSSIDQSISLKKLFRFPVVCRCGRRVPGVEESFQPLLKPINTILSTLSSFLGYFEAAVSLTGFYLCGDRQKKRPVQAVGWRQWEVEADREGDRLSMSSTKPLLLTGKVLPSSGNHLNGLVVCMRSRQELIYLCKRCSCWCSLSKRCSVSFCCW